MSCLARYGLDECGRLVLTAGVIGRIRAYVLKTESCWLWLGPIDKYQRGQVKFRFGKERLHSPVDRVMYGIEVRDLDDYDRLIHECGVPVCVNPAHLRPESALTERIDRAMALRERARVERKIGMGNVPLEERFWSKVDKSSSPHGCWLWTRSRTPSGYGQFRVGGKTVVASRFSWESLVGPIPSDVFVLHNCPGGDNPQCVNPAHLFLGTKADNMADCIKKGRNRPSLGDANGSRKHPERLKRGDEHPARMRPETRPRGLRHGTHTHPESVRRGPEVNTAKLREADVLALLTARMSGERVMVLATKFGVSDVQVYRICSGSTWSGVSEAIDRLRATYLSRRAS